MADEEKPEGSSTSGKLNDLKNGLFGHKYFIIVAILVIAIAMNLTLQPKQDYQDKNSTMENKTIILVENKTNYTIGLKSPINRETYGLNASMFAKLPEVPFDFAGVKQMFELSQFPLEKIDEEYYRQPEFYLNAFTSKDNLELFRNYPTDARATGGLRTYPSEYIAEVTKDGTFDAYFLIANCFGCVLYQGISLQGTYASAISLDGNAFKDGSHGVTQDVSYAKQHIKILNISPSDFVLEPTYTFYDLSWDEKGRMVPTVVEPHFEKNWVYKVKVTIKTENLAKGKYHVGVDFSQPDSSLASDWVMKYRTLYASGSAIGIGKPIFNLFIERS